MMTDEQADQQFETIAEIFAAVVLADNRAHRRELIEFAHACCVHNRKVRPARILPREEIVAIFQDRSSGIRQKLKNDTDNAYVTSLFESITDRELQRSILSSMFAISIADYEMHDAESRLIRNALSVWNMAMPSPDEVEKVVA